MKCIVAGHVAVTPTEFAELAFGIDLELFTGPVTESDLERANPSLNIHRLHPGARLTLPAAEPPPARTAPAKNMVNHTVRGDETFSAIARHYGISLSDILAANPGVIPERLYDGLVVKVPTKSKVTPT